MQEMKGGRGEEGAEALGIKIYRSAEIGQQRAGS